ncbi:MAG: PorT family protein [Flavobacterium psychrophilum]|nr:MAG: PorT family protein [Flavobacterium psychrophilum]
MKRIILLSVFLFALQAEAQVTVKPGVRAGLNLASVTNMDADIKPDFYIGGFVGIKLASFYTLQPEISYSRQGANSARFYDPYVIPGPYVTEKDYELQYVSLAVMNKFTFAESFYGIVGPSLDFKVSDNFNAEEDDDAFGVDFALNGGIGYTLPMGLSIEARYKLGLVDVFGDIYNDDYYYEDDNYDNIKLNSVLQIGVAYTF